MKIGKVFNRKATNHLEAKMFFDPNGGPQIARYDEVKYPSFENFTEKQLSFFWRPEEVDLSKDKLDFRDLPPEQQHIFTSNLKRQILLDSVQGRGVNLMLLPLASLPEVEVWLETWGTNETVHSRAYTHVIRNVYANPSEVFDELTDIQEILDCADDVSKYYDELGNWNALRTVWQNKKWFGKFLNLISGNAYKEYEHKKAFWLVLNSINILEGIRFYVSFACSWNFAELKKMEGNAKEIKLICRDENLHLGSTQYMLKTLPKDDPDYIKISEECREEVQEMFLSAIQQEKDWAKYLFKHGSMIGLSEEILCQYVDYIGSRRMKTVGIEVPFEYPTSDPLPWTKQWISGKEVQVAPQEAEISSYLVSDIRQDVDGDLLNDLSL
jgi:ribonucleoside-diphosphate reductase beta chain